MPDVKHFFLGERARRHAGDEMFARVTEGMDVIFQTHHLKVRTGSRI
jgi:hypothetical protein